MSHPTDLLYTKDHEWARVSGDEITVGITDHAQAALGDIVFCELPKVGRALKAHETFGVVESIKAVSDLYSPVSGTVTAINEAAVAEPGLINRVPHGDGWLIRMKPSNSAELSSLMKGDAYNQYVASLK